MILQHLGPDSERRDLRKQWLDKSARLGRKSFIADWQKTSKEDRDAFGGVDGENMARWKETALAADKARETIN